MLKSDASQVLSNLANPLHLLHGDAILGQFVINGAIEQVIGLTVLYFPFI